VWAENHIGEIWWDTSNARFLDYNQTNIAYASKNWGNLFPGSTIDIRQWIKSTTPPLKYTGPGRVVDPTQYSAVSRSNDSTTISYYYYFWVTNLDDVTTNKTLSINGVQQYIKTPEV